MTAAARAPDRVGSNRTRKNRSARVAGAPAGTRRQMAGTARDTARLVTLNAASATTASRSP